MWVSIDLCLVPLGVGVSFAISAKAKNPNQNVVLITGASSGLGLSFANFLVEQNYFVILQENFTLKANY